MKSEVQTRIHHILLYSGKEKTSFQLMHAAYLQFLTLTDRPRLYSLVPFGREFESVVVMEANQKNLRLIDLLVVIGDNETLMEVIGLYSCIDTPPILGIGNGAGLGFYNYLKVRANEVVAAAIRELEKGTLYTQKLMKLNLNFNCQEITEAVCQVEIHREMTMPIIILNLFLQNQKKEKVKIGTFRGDGLLISTPMGSYGKSLSLNGPLMSKTMENIMITPICPISMKFRPLCLPSTARIFIEIEPTCRSDYALVYVDERPASTASFRLSKGGMLRIRTSKYRANLVANLQENCQELFIKGLKSTIRWGENYEFVEMQQMGLRRQNSQLQSLMQL